MINNKRSSIKERETLDAKAWAEEYVLMGLRISSGISLSRYKQISGHGLAPERIAEFERAGLLVTSKDKLSATVQGSLVLDTVCRELLS